MTEQSPLTAFISPDTMSLQDVIDAVDGSGELTPARKREMLSALRSLSSWLKAKPEKVPASFAYLRRKMEKLHHSHVDVKKSRVDNVRSLTKAAFEVAGRPILKRDYMDDFTPAWAGLVQKLKKQDKDHGLMRLVRYCSANGVEPLDVSDEVIESFLDALTNEDLVKRPFVNAQSAVRIWNRCRDEIEGWPDVLLTPLLCREEVTFDFNAYPSSLLADLEAHVERLRRPDPFDPTAPSKALRPQSLKTQKYQVRQLAAGLVHSGFDKAAVTDLGVIVEPDNLKAALSFHIDRLRERMGPDVDINNANISGMAATALTIAKYHVKFDDTRLAAVRAIANRVSHHQDGMTDKNRQRLAILASDENIRRIMSLASTCVEPLLKKENPPRHDVVKMSTLVAIEILLVAPMRVGNLASLNIDTDLRLEQTDAGPKFVIHIPKSRVKNGIDLDFEITGGRAKLLQTYLKKFHPPRVMKGNRFLFPGRDGKPKRADTLSRQISKLVWDELGIEVNPHLFRHFAAWIALKHSPGNYELVRRLLGHKSFETALKAYEDAQAGTAFKAYDDILSSYRDEPTNATVWTSGRKPRGRRRR